MQIAYSPSLRPLALTTTMVVMAELVENIPLILEYGLTVSPEHFNAFSGTQMFNNNPATNDIMNGWLDAALSSPAARNARFRIVVVHVPPQCERRINGVQYVFSGGGSSLDIGEPLVPTGRPPPTTASGSAPTSVSSIRLKSATPPHPRLPQPAGRRAGAPARGFARVEAVR